MTGYLPASPADRIALFAAAIALVALGVTFWYSFVTRRQSLRVEKSQAYLQLEVASSDVFKYEADKALTLEPYRAVRVQPAEKRKLLAVTDAAVIAYNLYFQTLNLMEVCSRFRRQDVIEHEVFASWVAWCYDTLDDWYFRDQWHDFRCNYTDDVRTIFDIGVALFDPARFGDSLEVDAARKACFYAAVAKVMDCTEIAGWLSKTKRNAAETDEWPNWLAQQTYFSGSKATRPGRKPRGSSRASSAAMTATSAMERSSAG